MDRIAKVLEQAPWSILILGAVLMAVIPIGQSHFVEKWRMLFSGTLRRPLDWFDLVLHSFPVLLVAAKAFVVLRKG